MRRTVMFAAIAGLLTTPALARNLNLDPDALFSGMVAVRLTDPSIASVTAKSLPDYVKALVDITADGGTLPQGVEFPLANTIDDNARSITSTAHNVVARWLDPLTQDTSPEAPHYGANNDYIAYFGDGWKDDWKNGDQVTRHPQFSGDGKSGWIWTNHEYISNYPPTTTSAPIGQHLTLAKYLKKVGVLTNDVTSNTWSQADVDTYIQWFKKQIGGTWMRVYQDKETGEWKLDTTADNKRYNSTDNTLSRITGFDLTEPDHDDKGNTPPDGVAVGIAGDCSGGQSPWGTIFTAEENVQDFYGDLEAAWTSNHKLLTGKGFDPGADIDPDVTPSESGLYGRSSDSNQRHNRDLYGFPVEVDPGQDSDIYYQSVAENKGDGQGHRKHGSMGRARWENVAFATEHSFYLVGSKPIVMYGGNDRRSGRIYKWVSKGNFQYGMTHAETRALLDEGDLYVEHFTGLDKWYRRCRLLSGPGPGSQGQPGADLWPTLPGRGPAHPMPRPRVPSSTPPRPRSSSTFSIRART